MKAKYNIINEDIYNFDKSSFIIDVILTNTIVISLERQNWLKQV